jgi:hypothetical protein
VKLASSRWPHEVAQRHGTRSMPTDTQPYLPYQTILQPTTSMFFASKAIYPKDPGCGTTAKETGQKLEGNRSFWSSTAVSGHDSILSSETRDEHMFTCKQQCLAIH